MLPAIPQRPNAASTTQTFINSCRFFYPFFMSDVIIIAGMGPGLSLGIAEKFGAAGFKVGMISRNPEKLSNFQEQLQQKGIVSDFEAVDMSQTEAFQKALRTLVDRMGGLKVLQYNAVDARMVPLMQESIEDLVTGFRLSVANALASVKEVLPELKASKGAVLLSGGGTALKPSPDWATISIGKAGIRSLSLMLHQALAPEGIYAGTLTIKGWIHADSPTHSPKILGEKFWQMYQQRTAAEVEH
jgi:short-subunit dehydrogenase